MAAPGRKSQQRFNVRVTNPVIYAFPSDSESSDEEEDLKLQRHARRSQPIPELAYLARPINIWNIYRANKLKNMTWEPDHEYLAREKQHYENLEKMKRELLEKNRKKDEEELKKRRQELDDFNRAWLARDMELENELQKAIEKTRELVEEAIKADQKRQMKEAARLKAERERKEAEEKKMLEKKQKEEQEAQEKKEQAEREQLSKSASISGLEEYKKYTARLDYYNTHIKDKVESDDPLRKHLHKQHMTVKRILKQLQYYEHTVIQRHPMIRGMLLAAKEQTSQEGYEHLLRKAAEDFWLQVRTEVSSIAWGSYFYGKLAALLCSDTPLFFEYLMAELYTRCPYMIPDYHDHPSLSTDEMKLRQGYEQDEDGKFQDSAMHLLYQMAYVMVFAAMIQTGHGPVGVEQGWSWLSRTCNVPPRRITPALIYAFLNVAGEAMLEAYPRQMRKLLELILNELLPQVPEKEMREDIDIREGSAYLHELRRYIEHYFSTGVMRKLEEKAKSLIEKS